MKKTTVATLVILAGMSICSGISFIMANLVSHLITKMNEQNFVPLFAQEQTYTTINEIAFLITIALAFVLMVIRIVAARKTIKTCAV